jgi:histidine ammonia-lyase
MELLEQMVALLLENITPCAPLRGSFSVCGGIFHSELSFAAV